MGIYAGLEKNSYTELIEEQYFELLSSDSSNWQLSLQWLILLQECEINALDNSDPSQIKKINSAVANEILRSFINGSVNAEWSNGILERDILSNGQNQLLKDAIIMSLPVNNVEILKLKINSKNSLELELRFILATVLQILKIYRLKDDAF